MMNFKLLIVDDKEVLREVLSEVLTEEGYTIFQAASATEALNIYLRERPQIVLTDVKMGEMSGYDLLREIRKIDSDTKVIMMTAFASVDSAVEHMKSGAFDYLVKPFSNEVVRTVVNSARERYNLLVENKLLKEQLIEKFKFENIIGVSGKMQDMFQLMKKVLDTRATVLITGETGTGKELVAKALHYSSKRAKRPFVKVNCSAFPETLLESELFGHEKGAFTGAQSRREGRFEIADTGTIFLDEIGEISQSIQLKLLQVLQFKQFERLGSSDTIQVELRIVAATNRDLKLAIEDGSFREDLFYRLNVVPIHLPPLRERVEDIPLLVEHFLEKYASDNEVRSKSPTVEALDLLMRYRWPGNVRELENVIERALVLADSSELTVGDLPTHIRGVTKNNISVPSVRLFKLPEVVEMVENQMISEALDITDNCQSRAAEMLGIKRGTLIYKLKKQESDGDNSDDSNDSSEN